MDKDKKLTATLSVEQWNFILSLLGDAPYKKAVGIIQLLDEQFSKEMWNED